MARILVVDDDRPVAFLLADVIARDGHVVDTAFDGLAALARIEDQAYDAVVTDVRMPRLDGPGLVRELARLRPALSRRVIVVSGEAIDAATRLELEAAGVPILTKPFDLGRLLASVRGVLDR